MASAPINDLLTEAEAAARLRMGERTLRGLRQSGAIRYIALTKRKIAYRVGDCDEYLERRLRQDEPRGTSASKPRHKAGGNIVPFSQRG